MRRLLTLTTAFALASGIAFASETASDFYVKAGVGYANNMLKVKANNISGKLNKGAPIYLLGFGTNVNNDLRVDFTFDYSGYKKDSVKIHTAKFMINGEYDIAEITSDVKLYGTAGVGAGKIIAHSNKGYGAFKTKLAWALGAGVNGKITDTIAWDFGYKYTDILNTKGTNSNNVTFDPAQHSLMATFRFGL